MSKPALGRGLGALIPKGAEKPESERGILEVELTRIVPNAYQPRKEFKDEALRELADSIKSKGVIQPVLLQKNADGGYSLIAGERRFRAARMAGLKKIPAVIKDVSPEEALELALIENIQREDLNPVETAEAYNRLMQEFGLTQEQTSEKVGKERSTVANYLRLLGLPADVKQDIAGGALSMGHAKALLSLDSPQKQMALRRDIIARGLSVREAEAAARRMKSPGRIRKKSTPSAQVSMLEDELKQRLGTRVHIKTSGKGGRIEIEYYSGDEFERLLAFLRG
jgi:ParB family chromosome partitioning protein